MFFPQIPPGENVRMDAAMVDSNLASPWPPVEVQLRSSDSENDFSNSDCLNNLEISIEAEPQSDQNGDSIDDTSDSQLSAVERNCIKEASVAVERKTREERSTEDGIKVKIEEADAGKTPSINMGFLVPNFEKSNGQSPKISKAKKEIEEPPNLAEILETELKIDQNEAPVKPIIGFNHLEKNCVCKPKKTQPKVPQRDSIAIRNSDWTSIWKAADELNSGQNVSAPDQHLIKGKSFDDYVIVHKILNSVYFDVSFVRKHPIWKDFLVSKEFGEAVCRSSH